jgi:hypothetical protein
MKKVLFALFALFLPGFWGGDMSALSEVGQWLNRPREGNPEPQRINQQVADAQHEQRRAAQPVSIPWGMIATVLQIPCLIVAGLLLQKAGMHR